MGDKQPQSSSDDALAIPHRLCRCCERFAEDLFRLRPTMRSKDRRKCTQYDCLQDLIDGAQERCHLCIIAMNNLEQQMIREVWLQSKSEANELAISTYIGTHKRLWFKHTSISLRVTDPRKRSKEERADHASLYIVESPKRNDECTYPQWLERAHFSKHVASDEHYRLIQKWLAECMDEVRHPMCNSNKRFRRPTRLLDLTRYTEDVMLVKGNDSDRPYAALSYCWGSVPQPMLLQTNLKQFENRIAWSELSKVSQDAISVCRRLSIAYLWIDALCITQGADGDFLTEAPRMQDVYAGSIFTVVAAFSKDTSEPFLLNRTPLKWIDCELGPFQDKDGPFYKVKAEVFCINSHPGVNNIDSRAWYLQERLLSPRSIYFGRDGIHWECRKGAACEYESAIEEDHAKRHHVNGVYLKSRYAGIQSMQSKHALDGSKAHAFWKLVLGMYLPMELSHPEDRLIAIAGIASIFESNLGWRSTYGLWIDRIAEELLWYYVRPSYTRGIAALTQPVPSWSWLSANGRPIHRYVSSPTSHEMDDFYSATLISWPADSGFNMSLLKSPTDIRLCIRGHLVPYIETWTGFKSDDPSTRSARGSYRFHERDADIDETDQYCLLLFCQISHKMGSLRHCNYGLILTPVNIAERRYRRTGVIMEEYPADGFPNAPASQFVKEKFLTDLWAPVGEEQEIFIV